MKGKKRETKRSTISSVKRLFSYTLKHKCLLTLATVSLIVTSLGIVILPYLAGRIVDNITSEDPESKRKLDEIAVQFTGVFVLVALFSFIRGTAYNLLGENVVLEIRNALFYSLVQKVWIGV